MQQIRQFVLILWVSPMSLLAIMAGMLFLPFGARVQRKGATLEVYGGPVTWLLSRTPVSAAAMTLGHIIWGQSATALDFSREHELVHVRQYERWGPFFVPMYFLWSLIMWFRGKHPYYDNPFEREAYDGDHPYYRNQHDASLQ